MAECKEEFPCRTHWFNKGANQNETIVDYVSCRLKKILLKGIHGPILETIWRRQMYQSNKKTNWLKSVITGFFFMAVIILSDSVALPYVSSFVCGRIAAQADLSCVNSSYTVQRCAVLFLRGLVRCRQAAGSGTPVHPATRSRWPTWLLLPEGKTCQLSPN